MDPRWFMERCIFRSFGWSVDKIFLEMTQRRHELPRRNGSGHAFELDR
jgi:hypothetical protein